MTPRILVTGSRNWNDAHQLQTRLYGAIMDLTDGTTPITLVSGGCPTGADRLAEDYWQSIGWPIERHPAAWNAHDNECPPWHHGLERCRRAGYRRNALMASIGADVCVAFPLGESAGTRMMMKLARQHRIRVVDGSVA